MSPPETGVNVLLAANEPSVQQFVMAALQREHITVLAAGSGTEASGLARNHAGKIDLLIADRVELAEEVIQETPAIRALLLSGTDDAARQAAEKGFPFLALPFNATVLIEQVRTVLAGSGASAERTAGGSGGLFGMAPARSNSIPPEERQKLEGKLLARVRHTAQAYQAATAEAQDMIGYSREIGWDHPDGRKALHNAVAFERCALDKYSRALKTFTNLVVRGQKPPRREILESLLDAAVESTGADKGLIEVLDRAKSVLRMEVQRGFERPFLDFIERLGGQRCSGGEALRTGRRVIVVDVAGSLLFDDLSKRILLDAGVRALQSTPVFDRAGRVLGVISTHYATLRQPSGGDFQLIEELASQAASLLDGEG